MLLNCGAGEVPWTARRSNQSILKEISPEYSLEGLMLKLKLQYFGCLMQIADELDKTLMLGKLKAHTCVCMSGYMCADMCMHAQTLTCTLSNVSSEEKD